MINVNKYIGIPWCDSGRTLETGFDCYGIVRYFYEQEYDIILPLHEGISSVADGNEGCSTKLVATTTYQLFHKVNGKPEFGDIIIFNIGGLPIHIAINIGNGMMLHAEKKSGGVVIESYKNSKWERRFDSFYRLGVNDD